MKLKELRELKEFLAALAPRRPPKVRRKELRELKTNALEANVVWFEGCFDVCSLNIWLHFRLVYFPILNFNTTNTTEVVNIVCHHHHLMLKRNGANGHVKVLYLTAY